MKLKGLLIVALALATVPLLLASEKSEKKSITLGETAQVGHATLQPGDYKLEWNGTGQNVNVNFMQRGKVVATAPATVQSKASGNQTSINLKDQGNGSKALTEIDFNNMALVFQPGAGNAGMQPTSR